MPATASGQPFLRINGYKWGVFYAEGGLHFYIKDREVVYNGELESNILYENKDMQLLFNYF